MREKFGHKITNRINEVFDSHRVDFNPQDWESLKAQLPERKSRIAFVFWAMAKVAAVVLLALIGIYMFWGRESFDGTNDRVVENSLERFQGENPSEVAIVDPLTKPISENPVRPENNLNVDKDNLAREIAKPNPESKKQSKTSEPTSRLIADILIESKLQESTSGISRQPGSNPENKTAQQISSSTVTQGNIIITDTAGINQDREVPQPVPPFTKPKKEKFKLGVEMATFANYSKDNVKPSMSYGGGIAANIPMNKKFSFNPGLFFSAYNMELQNSQDFVPQSNLASFTTSGNYPSDPNITAMEMQLTGFDIPINFQYRFLKREKGNYFLELGFSSLWYISQDYSYELSYVDYSTAQAGIVHTKSEETPIEDFKAFDFAKFLNFSVGLDYHLSKRFDMVVNPYLKYPVNMLSGDELKFGSGGLKLKFMIVPKK